MRASSNIKRCFFARQVYSRVFTPLFGRETLACAPDCRTVGFALTDCSGAVRFGSNSAGVRKSVRKKFRKRRALRIRQAVEYASQFDPRMVTTLGLRQTFRKVNWPVQENFEIAEGVVMPFVLRDKFLAFEVAVEEDFYPDTRVLKKEILEKHAQARRKGWKVAVVDQSEWKEACAPPQQHVGRHMYLVELLAKQLPIEDRR